MILLLIIKILSVGYLIEEKENVKIVNTQNVSNKKIGWGIKRANNHEQPDLGSKNIKMLKENNGIAIGNKESKKTCFAENGTKRNYTQRSNSEGNNSEGNGKVFSVGGSGNHAESSFICK